MSTLCCQGVLEVHHLPESYGELSFIMLVEGKSLNSGMVKQSFQNVLSRYHPSVCLDTKTAAVWAW